MSAVAAPMRFGLHSVRSARDGRALSDERLPPRPTSRTTLRPAAIVAPIVRGVRGRQDNVGSNGRHGLWRWELGHRPRSVPLLTLWRSGGSLCDPSAPLTRERSVSRVPFPPSASVHLDLARILQKGRSSASVAVVGRAFKSKEPCPENGWPKSALGGKRT